MDNQKLLEHELTVLDDLSYLDRDTQKLEYLQAKDELYRTVGVRLDREHSLEIY